MDQLPALYLSITQGQRRPDWLVCIL